MRTPIPRRIFQGYLGIFKSLGFLLALLASSAGFGFLVSWPLWLFATSRPSAFTLSALAAIAAGVVYLCVRGVLRVRTRRGRNPLLSALLVIVWLLLFLGGGYAVLILVFRGMYLAAFPVFAALLLGLGYLASALQGKKHSA
jgi:hypothetical protein